MNALTAEGSAYGATIWAHFRAPLNVGGFPEGMAEVSRGRGGLRRMGRDVEFALRITAEGRIADCRYRVYGCPATIALCSLTSTALPGQTLAEAEYFSVVRLADGLGLPAEKRAAAIAVEDAIRGAIRRYNGYMKPPRAD